ncbi:MAG: hypothetical protein AB7N24_00515 [Dehalococcoidia bacterium]
MFGISTALRSAQRSRRRLPLISATVYEQRFAVPYFPLTPQDSDAEASAPHDCVYSERVDSFGRARNNAGSLDAANGINGAGWANVDTVTAGQGVALRYDPVARVFGLLYGDGNDLKFRTSVTALSGSWSAATTIVTEASPIGSVALAFDDAGDACAFYTLGTGTTVNRLRRTSGSWAGSGTNWSRSGSVASITGLSAVWKDDYLLVVTGTEVTTTHERLWAVSMGDQFFPANAWSALVSIAEADAAAATTFTYPHLTLAGSQQFATFQQTEAGNVAASRAMLTSTNSDLDHLGPWREPYPLAVAASSHGAAIGYADPASELNVYAPSEWLAAVSRSATDLSSRVLSCSWRETPTRLSVKIELDNSQGDALQATNNAPGTYTTVALGYDVVIRNGLTTPTGAGLAGLLRANIARITTRYAPGRSTVVLDCDGPWEQMARYASPGAWTAPTATTRRAIFRRIAGRAGLAIVDSSALAPSTAWTTDTPAFAIAPGESAAATLRRLLAPTPDFLRLSSDGGFEICGFGFADDPPSDESAFGFLQPDTNYPNPYLDFARVLEREPNWTRAVGSDRYADAFADADIDTALPFPPEPLFELVRELSISSDAEAEAIAVNALARRLHLVPQGELIAPLASQFELYDIVSVALPSSHGSLDGAFRIVERGADYRRDPKGQPAYNSVFGFARR